jgi:hypothetical protein
MSSSTDTKTKTKPRSSSRTSNETTPLLTTIEPTPIPEDAALPVDAPITDDGVERRPLDKTQVFLLCFANSVAPIAFFSIFPYVNFMIERVGNVDKAEVGFWSGLIESLFSAVQMCVMIFWGRVSVVPNSLTWKEC